MNIAAHELPRSYWRKVAEKNGIRRKTFETRISRGWAHYDAATRPPRAGWRSAGSRTYEKCRQAGLSEDAVSRYRRRHGKSAAGMSDEEIIKHLRIYHTKSVRALATRAGINRKTLESRLRSGWPLERALSEPVNAPGSSIHKNRRRA